MWNDPDPARQAKVRQYVKELSYHGYCSCPTSDTQAIGDTVTADGLTAGMLEKIGAAYNYLQMDLQLGHNSDWQQYTLAYPAVDTGAQYFTLDLTIPTNPVITMGSRTRYLRQYFKFIPRGAVRIGATSVDPTFDPVAFINSNGKYVVVVKAAAGGTFTVGGLPAGTYGLKYTTDSQYDVDLPDVSGLVVSASIPEAGVLTLYMK